MSGTSPDNPKDADDPALPRDQPPQAQSQQQQPSPGLSAQQPQSQPSPGLAPQPSHPQPSHPSPGLAAQQPLQQQPSPNLSAQYSYPKVSLSHDHDDEFDEKQADGGPSRLDTFNILEPTESNDFAAKSPSNQRADASRLGDDMELLRAERLISNQEQEMNNGQPNRPAYQRHDTNVEDAFNPPIEAETKVVKHRDETAPLYKLWLFLRKFPRFLRYLVYLIPGATLLLIPILLGALAIDEEANPVGGWGGTPLMWFGIWLEIVWCSLWIARMVTNLMPHIFHSIAKVTGSTNSKKWKDIGHDMELHTALFLWLLAVIISFKPICDNHRVHVPDNHKDDVDRQWINIVFKVIIAFFVLATLNFVEKIIIQWIAGAFHERTYATRMENNKGDIRQLVRLFEYAKTKLERTDSFWQGSRRPSSGDDQTPMQALHENARQVLGKVGQVAGKVGNDFIGRKADSNQSRKIVSELLRTTSSSHTLARLLYRSLVRDDQEMVFPEDMQNAFYTQEESEAAFNVFDKDLNGDISMDEFETVINEISLEKKAIAASLKDLDSVIQKLDKVFLFIILIVTIIVFISIISGSAAAGLASAGSSVLGLAWMLQATAQEFLQSIIFVFVKHPFDVGDRVTIYGSTGATMTGDDYYVTEISLLYTEFKKLQGHVVQAPNSLLNTLFILNQRRSNGLSYPIPLQIRFGTPAWMLDELKARMLEFVINNKRDYQPTIITELSAIDEMRSATYTVVPIHKSNFQNELLRLARHNKFMTELMYQMEQIGIQSPFRIEPGGSRDNPMHWAGTQPPPSYTRDNDPDHPPQAPPPQASSHPARQPSVNSGSSFARSRANTGQAPTTDASLNNFQDVFENRRENLQANRLASIKEKNQATKLHDQAMKETEVESEPRASSSAVAPAGSINSRSRSRMWNRPRALSRTTQQSGDAAV